MGADHVINYKGRLIGALRHERGLVALVSIVSLRWQRRNAPQSIMATRMGGHIALVAWLQDSGEVPVAAIFASQLHYGYYRGNVHSRGIWFVP